MKKQVKKLTLNQETLYNPTHQLDHVTGAGHGCRLACQPQDHGPA
jgi:hypothetical protein